MSSDLQVQAQMGAQLVSSLDSIVTTSDSLNKSFNRQLDISNELQKAALKLSDNFKTISSNLCKATADFNDIVNSASFKKSFGKETQEINNACKKAVKSVEESSSTLEQISNQEDKITDQRNRQTRERRKAYKQRIVAFKENNKFLRGLDKAFQASSSAMKDLTKKFKETPLVKRAFKTQGLSLIIDIPRMIIVNAFKVIGSLVSATANFFKTVMSLPFIIANFAVRIGNGFRSSIIEGIGNAYQATKEYSDANSLIGQGMSNLRNMAVGSLKTFENPRSQLVKLFGTGTAGAQSFLSEIAKSIDEMGPLAEIFGHQVSNSEESALYLVYAKRSLGLSSKEIAYYALDAGTHLENIFERLDSVRDAVETAAKNHSVDTKQVSLGMQKLRVNIKDFGHLSDQSLSDLVARMRQLNVGAEDLVGVFNKFKSFDDAAKTSAMLFQSFQMNVDALDLITAKDPGEIVNRLRDAMFATGKSYEELNRHEKQLMQQTTGMTDAMLKSLMTYQNMGLSYEEAKQRIANDDPTKKQIKAIKGLTSSINEIQKVMNFTSPFQAFMKGLSKNLHGSKKAKEMATSLSKMYETIYLFGLNLEGSTIKQLTTPIISIVRRIDDVFKSQRFKEILSSGTEIASSVMSHLAGDMHTNKGYKSIIKSLDNIQAMEKTPSTNLNADKAKIKNKALSIINLQNNSEVNAFLKKKNILTDDGKFVKGITLDAILRQLKSASLEMSSSKGKAAIEKINLGIESHVDNLIAEYMHFREFKTNKGVRGQIKKTTEDLKKMFTSGGGPLKSMFDLGRKLMGGIIKGTAIAFTVFLKILNGTIDDFYDKSSSPILALIQDSTGLNKKNMTILGWLGISGEDSDAIQSNLATSLRGLVNSGWTLAKAGLSIGSQFYKMFADMASFMISKFAQVIYTFYMASDGLTKMGMDNAFEMDKIKEEAFASAGGTQAGLAGLTSFVEKQAAEDKKSTFQDLQMTTKSLFPFVENLRENYKGVSPPDGPYGDYLNVYAKIYNAIVGLEQSSGLTGFLGRLATAKNLREYYKQIALLAGIKAEKMREAFFSAIQYKRLVEILKSKFKDSSGKIDNTKLTKAMSHYDKIILNSTNAHISRVISRDTKGAISASGTLNTLDEDKAHSVIIDLLKSTSKITDKGGMSAEELMSKHPVKDGTFGALNSILSTDGFKLFTQDGKIIIPDSMDELATISDSDSSSLINLFSSAAIAYKEAAVAVSVMKENSGLNRNKDEYEASSESIDKMINLVYETLDVCINRDIKVNKQVSF